ncbi:MAG: hypothetical protein E6G94_13715 [Alphaproteobacteria bacterium]|nr:MAG: hypothetical protein E6G94_13715 [Alphaproteobacteria bacterium]
MNRLLNGALGAAAIVLLPAAVMANPPANSPGKSGSAPNQSAQGAASSAHGQAIAQAAGNPCKPNPKGPGGPKGHDCEPVTPACPKK